MAEAIFKVILAGEGGVGKTSLLKRATENTFDANMKLTVGVDFAIHKVSDGDWNATLQFWDLGGQIRFRELVISYFVGARLGIAVFDITSRYTMDRLHDWIENLRKAEGDIDLIIVGNKVDLREELGETRSLVTSDEGRAFASQYGLSYVETSAKEDIGIDALFQEITQLLKAGYIRTKTDNDIWNGDEDSLFF
ncbi:MAG: Rab family GTPase [Promethearchaeota archaeon]